MTSEIAACIALAVIFISTVLFAVWITVMASRVYGNARKNAYVWLSFPCWPHALRQPPATVTTEDHHNG